MNIYELRRNMKVTNYYSHSEGAVINYTKANKTGSINLTRDVLIAEAIAIGSLDDDNTEEEKADYILSQYDALNIAIRFEAAREMEKEIENSDIGNAIKKITP